MFAAFTIEKLGMGLGTRLKMLDNYIDLNGCHLIFLLLTDITISLTSSVILATESESVQVSIAVFGFPDNADPYLFRSPLEAFILLYTDDGSAIGTQHCCHGVVEW